MIYDIINGEVFSLGFLELKLYFSNPSSKVNSFYKWVHVNCNDQLHCKLGSVTYATVEKKFGY